MVAEWPLYSAASPRDRESLLVGMLWPGHMWTRHAIDTWLWLRMEDMALLLLLTGCGLGLWWLLLLLLCRLRLLLLLHTGMCVAGVLLLLLLHRLLLRWRTRLLLSLRWSDVYLSGRWPGLIRMWVLARMDGVRETLMGEMGRRRRVMMNW